MASLLALRARISVRHAICNRANRMTRADSSLMLVAAVLLRRRANTGDRAIRRPDQGDPGAATPTPSRNSWRPSRRRISTRWPRLGSSTARALPGSSSDQLREARSIMQVLPQARQLPDRERCGSAGPGGDACDASCAVTNGDVHAADERRRSYRARNRWYVAGARPAAARDLAPGRSAVSEPGTRPTRVTSVSSIEHARRGLRVQERDAFAFGADARRLVDQAVVPRARQRASAASRSATAKQT